MLVLAVELAYKETHNWRATALWFAPVFISFPVWLIVPRVANEATVNVPETILQNSAWFLQGMAFPTTWTGGWIRDKRGWDGFWTAVFLSTTTLISGAIVLQRTRAQFAHALDESGQLVTQADGYAWARTHPMGEWLPHTYVQDTRYLNTTDDTIQVQIGLYHAITGERLSAETATGQPIPNNSVSIDQQER